MWWPCISPVQPYPRSGPWQSCPPHGYCVWQTPPRWCSCPPGWTHCGWSERAGYSCPHLSRRSEPLRMKRTRVREINQRMVLLNAIVFAIVPGDTHDTERLSRFHVCACRNRPPFTAITFEYFTHKGCVSTKLLTMNDKGTTEEQHPFSPTQVELRNTGNVCVSRWQRQRMKQILTDTVTLPYR